MTPVLPFKPEPVEQLAARFDAALERLFDLESITLGVASSPYLRPEHRFDFEIGVRFNVFRLEDQAGEHRQATAFVSPGTAADHVLRRVERQTRRRSEYCRHFRGIARELFRQLSGGRFGLTLESCACADGFLVFRAEPAAVPCPVTGG